MSAPCSFRAAFPSEHPLKNESMKQCIRREKANPRSTKVPSSYGFVLRQSPRPRHLPEGNKISERYFFGFVEKPTPLRASLHIKAEIQHFSGSSVILGSPQELRRPGRCDGGGESKSLIKSTLRGRMSLFPGPGWMSRKTPPSTAVGAKGQ